MRADRLLSLLLLLQSRGRLTAADLAERLEVSPRTIYRDLDALSAAGVPVYAERGPNGGCVLQPGYRTDLTGLTQAEVASLFAGSVAPMLARVGLGSALQSALVKLEAALPGPRREEASRLRSRVHVDASAWFGADEQLPQLAALREAVFEEKTVRLTYRRADRGEVTKLVDPLGLVVKGGTWYLVGLSAGETRVFRISRIRKVGKTLSGFEWPRGFDLASFWERWSHAFVARIPQYRVTVCASKAALTILPQVFGDRIHDAIAAGRRTRKGVTIELTFDSPEAACGRLLGLGTLVEVLAPVELRRLLRVRAEQVARHYEAERE